MSDSVRQNLMDTEKMYSAIRQLVSERDWHRFHTPKNITMALTGEAGELSEIFQWMTDDEILAMARDPQKSESLRDELADIFYYTLRLCDLLGVDLERAFWEKLNKTRQKYPVELAKGNATKYTDFKR
jgi:dCTP diphosphatase